MKVAVCLSGQPRTFRSVANNIVERFQDPNVEVHYYIHCWLDNESYTQGAIQNTEYIFEQKENLIRELTEYFNPDKIVVESRQEMPKNGASQWDYQMYSVQKSVRLAEDLVGCDWLFWTRMDLFFSEESSYWNWPGDKIKNSKINYQTIKDLIDGINYGNIIRKEDDNVENYNYRKDLVDISIFNPHGRASCLHWCNYHIQASDWFLAGKPSVMFNCLGTLYDGFQWYKQRFPEREKQMDCADVSMELFYPLWCQLNRYSIIECKPDIFLSCYPNVIIFRKVCEIVGVDPETKIGLSFVWALQDIGDCFEQGYSIEKVQRLWKIWSDLYGTEDLENIRKQLTEIAHGECSDFSVGKGNKNTVLV